MKPLIGVPCYGESGKSTGASQRYTLSRTYVEGIHRAGGAVVMIPPCADPELLRPIYNTLFGLLLAGGGDIHPGRYGRPNLGSVGIDPERDETEILLTRWAMEDDLPILAICRGIQLLNVALGGTLVQDVPSQVPGALCHHPGPAQPRPQPQHSVTVTAGSRLAAILGQGRAPAQAEVNSFHHQATEEPAPSLRIVARAPDGVIEALECPDRTFVVGVQWHPEEMAATQPAQQALFVAHVTACITRRAHV